MLKDKLKSSTTFEVTIRNAPRRISLDNTGMNSRWQSGQHRVYMYSKGRPLNMYPQLCSLLFLDFWLFFLYHDEMKNVIYT